MNWNKLISAWGFGLTACVPWGRSFYKKKEGKSSNPKRVAQRKNRKKPMHQRSR
jgi:hypothetical protein